MNVDHVNAFFEIVGALLQAQNVNRLLRDRKVAGVDWRVTALFAAWGCWNIYFYRAVETPWSAAGAVGMTLANVAWVCLALRVKSEERHVDKQSS